MKRVNMEVNNNIINWIEPCAKKYIHIIQQNETIQYYNASQLAAVLEYE